jgi:hypothetical protein
MVDPAATTHLAYAMDDMSEDRQGLLDERKSEKWGRKDDPWKIWLISIACMVVGFILGLVLAGLSALGNGRCGTCTSSGMCVPICSTSEMYQAEGQVR